MGGELKSLLGRFRRRRLLVEAWAAAAGALAAWGAVGTALAATNLVFPGLSSAQVRLGGMSLLGPVLLGFGVYLLRLGWHDLRIARLVDLSAGLKDRLTTAVELLQGRIHSPFAERQVADALARGSELAPARVFPWRWHPLRWAAAGALVALFFWLSLQTNPRDRVLAREAEARQAIAAVQANVEQLKNELGNAENPSPELQQAREQLERLSRELAQAGPNQEQALARLGEAEQNLAGRLNPRSQAERFGLDRLARELDRSGQAPGTGNRFQQGDRQAPAQALENIAGQLGNLSAESREALAQALERAAQTMRGINPALADRLQQAADALRRGDLDAARQALEEAGRLAGEMGRRVSDQERLARVLDRLEAQRQQLAGQQSGALARAQGQQAQPGAGAQAGQPGQPGQSGPGSQAQAGAQGGDQAGQGGQAGQAGSGNQGGQGAGSNQSGPGAGFSGQASGPVAGSTAPRSQGGVATGGGQPLTDRPGTTGTGELDAVYAPVQRLGSQGQTSFIPGQQSAGPVERQAGDGPVELGQLMVPYQEVIGQYQSAAGRALEGGYVPGPLKDLVKAYFDSLSQGR